MNKIPIQWNVDVGIVEGHLDDNARWKRPDLAPGTAAWECDLTGKKTGIAFVCPCGCGDVISIPIAPVDGLRWVWDGNESAPTLSGSILRPVEGNGCGWHGHLIKGIFETC